MSGVRNGPRRSATQIRGFVGLATDQVRASERGLSVPAVPLLQLVDEASRSRFLPAGSTIVNVSGSTPATIRDRFEEMRRIVDLLLGRARTQLRAQEIDLEVTQAAKDHLIKIGYDADYGARPLRRTIQYMVEDPLAEALLLGRFVAGQTILVDRSPDAGLTIEPIVEMAPVEAVEVRGAAGEPLRLSGLRRELCSLGRPLPPLWRLGLARRDHPSPRAGRTDASWPGGHVSIDPGRPCRCATSRRLRSAGCRWASPRSIGCSGAGSCPERWCSSAESPASASPRSSSRPLPGVLREPPG